MMVEFEKSGVVEYSNKKESNPVAFHVTTKSEKELVCAIDMMGLSGMAKRVTCIEVLYAVNNPSYVDRMRK
jgi:hypothetical protein